MLISQDNKRLVIFNVILLSLGLSILIPILVNASGCTLNAKVKELQGNGFAVTPDALKKLYAPISDNPIDAFNSFAKYLKTNNKDLATLDVIAVNDTIRDCPGKLAEEAQSLLGKHEKFFTTVRDTAASHKQIRFEKNWENGYIYPDETTIMEMLFRKIKASAYFAGLKNDREMFMAYLDTMDSFINWETEYPDILSFIVSTRHIHCFLDMLESVFEIKLLSDNDLQSIGFMLSKQERMLHAAKSTSGEAATIYSTHITLKNYDTVFGGTPLAPIDNILIPFNNLFSESKDKAMALDCMFRTQEVLKYDFYQKTDMIDDLNEIRKNVTVLSPYIHTRESISFVKKFIIMKNTAVAKLRCARTAVAVELFRRKYGKLPETLSELVPEFIDKIPVDPFDGKELRYVKGTIDFNVTDIVEKTDSKGRVTPNEYEPKNAIVKADGFRVYSIGRNLKDDGGNPTPCMLPYNDEPDVCFSVMSNGLPAKTK